MMGEALLGYGMSCVFLCFCFRQLNRYQQKRLPIIGVSILLHSIVVGIVLTTNIFLIGLLYEPMLALFTVDTDGFMNLNGLFTACVLWSISCVLLLVLVGKVKAQLGCYHRTVRITLTTFALLPLLFIGAFLFLASFK